MTEFVHGLFPNKHPITNTIKFIKNRMDTNLYNDLKGRVLEKGFTFFEGGDYDLNIIFDRLGNKYTNYLTDLGYIAYTVGAEKKVLKFNCSTKAGLYGEGSVLNPRTVAGITGTAVIIGNAQYRSAYSFTNGNGTGRLPWGYSYFQQIGLIDYWRDGTK
jgi:hypothetical protein